jgi:hypothetical protein
MESTKSSLNKYVYKATAGGHGLLTRTRRSLALAAPARDASREGGFLGPNSRQINLLLQFAHVLPQQPRSRKAKSTRQDGRRVAEGNEQVGETQTYAKSEGEHVLLLHLIEWWTGD